MKSKRKQTPNRPDKSGPAPEALARSLQGKRLVYITTYNAEGKPGTVEVWFAHDNGRVFIYTGRSSVKAQKLLKDPRATLAFGSRSGPRMDGKAQFRADEASIRRAVTLLNAKYDNYYGPVDAVVNTCLHGDGVMLEITPL